MVKKLEISHTSQILTNDCQILILSELSNYYFKQSKTYNNAMHFGSLNKYIFLFAENDLIREVLGTHIIHKHDR